MRRFLRFLIGLCVILILIPVGLGVLLLEDQPLVASMPAPKPEDVRFTRAFVQKVRLATDATEPGADEIALPVAELRGMMRLGSRLVPHLRADAVIEGDAVNGSASLPVPWFTGKKWLNVTATIPAFEGQIKLRAIAVGPWNLPPDLALVVGQLAANLVLGDHVGDTILESASGMRIEDQTMTFTLRLDREGRGDVMQSVFKTLRHKEMPDPAQIDGIYTKIREAMDAGTLPATGSYTPYVTFALEAALEGSTAETLANDYTAAMLALTKACAGRDFMLIIGRLAGDTLKTFGTWRTDCSKMTLAGRVDLRLHFTISAALKAASNRGFAITVGEFKELNDSLRGSTGFDFSDITANNSGIRLSDLFMAQPPEIWPSLIARMKSESDFLGGFDGLPKSLTEDAFKERFGDVNSPAYREMLATIEANIDRTALHATPPGP